MLGAEHTTPARAAAHVVSASALKRADLRFSICCGILHVNWWSANSLLLRAANTIKENPATVVQTAPG
jgi:hypothetical protein